ncbi:helix-turn-helix transcriptional regulator [Anaerosporobacter sp.]|uniref:helix-turn-helix transcriptional regulator n=1 Tax=Anaerosporobacter sp. TaxID=1872529 RepID=UPI00286F023E|nr:AraC family transcriptional regulator [Anaerosporobacter sp.]
MQTNITSSDAFTKTVLTELQFKPIKQKNCILYQNPNRPEDGYLLSYVRPNCYSFGIADFTVPHCFRLTFDNPEHLIRFGIVYKGSTNFKLENQPISSFKPSSFFVIEKGIKGQQAWKRGEHYHGAEIILYESYVTQYLKEHFHFDFDYSKFSENVTYPYLPLEVNMALEKMQTLSAQNSLNPLILESCILECISAIVQTVESSSDNAFTKQLHYGKVKIGTNKYLHLSTNDIQSIQKAHEILTISLQAPPTIEHLSELVLLSPQKLKAGFSYYYHMSIGRYITSTRMATAENLLSTTNLSIAEIAEQVGYPYASNFIKMFRQTYQCTPLEYRHRLMCSS